MFYGYAMAHRYSKTHQKHSFTEKVKIAVLSTIGKTMSLEKILKKQENPLCAITAKRVLITT